MKRVLLIAFVLIILGIVFGVAIQRTPFLRNVTAPQSGTITANVPTDTLSIAYLSASNIVFGQKQFAHATAVDTLVNSAFLSGDYIFFCRVGSDTTGVKGFSLKSIKTDTAFVLQLTSGTYTTTTYNWIDLK